MKILVVAGSGVAAGVLMAVFGLPGLILATLLLGVAAVTRAHELAVVVAIGAGIALGLWASAFAS
jgi:hypothetical protein